MKPLVGITLKVVSALAFSFMSAGVKYMSEFYPIGQLVFFRSAFALIPLVIWIALTDQLINAVRTHNLRGHFLRSLMGVASMGFGFTALSFLPLSNAVAIGYASPLIVVVLAVFFLKERVRIYRWSAVAIGFTGVLIMLSPHLGLATADVSPDQGFGAMLALIGACLGAVAVIQLRRLTQTERTGAIVFYFSAFSALAGLATIAFGWTMPDLRGWVILIGIGILGGIGQILLTQAYRHGDASLIAPFDYTTMLWSVLLGWFIFGEWPATVIFVGASVVIGAGIFVIWREHKLGLSRAKEAAAASPQRPL